MAWDIPDILKGIFGINAPQVAAATPPPSLSTPGGPVGGSGIGGTPPAGGSGIGGIAPATPATPSAATPTDTTAATPVGQFPSTINIPGMGQIAMPKQSAFDNPWLQAALAAYGGFAGSPRAQGWGGAIRSALGGGAQAYQQARASQWTPYKTLAELQHAGAETQLAQAQARESQLKSEQMAGIWETNKGTATALRQYAQIEPNKYQKQALLDSADQLDKNKWQYVKLDEAMGLATKVADINQKEAETEHTQATTVTEQARPEEVRAQTALERAQALTQATEQDKNRAAAALDRIKTKQAPQELLNETTKAAADWAKATDPTDKAQKLATLQTAIDKETNWFGSFFTTAAQRASYNDQRMRDLGITTDAPFMPGAKLAPLPTYKGTNKPVEGWKHDPNDPTGRTVLDPDGIPHQVQ